MTSNIHQILNRARNRLRRRYIIRWMATGFGLSTVVVLCLSVLSRFWWPLGPVSPWLVFVLLLLTGLILGGFLGAFQPILGTRQLALMLDRTFQTDEAIVTHLHLLETGQAEEQPEVTEILARRIATLPAVSERLPVSLSGRLRWPLVAAIVGFLILLLPQRKDATVNPFEQETTPLQDQVAELEDALESITEKYDAPLSESVEERLEELARTLDDSDLSAEEAAAEIQDVQEMLDAFEDSLQDAADELQHLEDAADELAKQEETQALAESLENADMEGAAEAVESLMEQLEQATEEERQNIGEQLERAGEQMSHSENDDMQRAGEAMKEAGQDLQNQSAEGKESGEGTHATDGSKPSGANGQGQDSASSSAADQNHSTQDASTTSGAGETPHSGQGETAQDKLDRLQQQLRDNERLAERMKQDAERLKQSQEINGALEAANQGMGGQPGVDEGQGQGQQGQGQGQQGQGQGQQGQGQGQQGQGQGQGMTQAGGSQSGSGHTWEDEGTHDTTGGHRDANRLNERTEGMTIDDFEQFYAPIRLEGVEGAVTGVTGEIDASGQLETVPTRLTEGQERSSTPTLSVPEGYKDAAERAMNNERVPPGYRNSVRQYFESVE